MPPTRRKKDGPAGKSAGFAGKTLGRCRIEGPIGTGATATVFRAHYLPLKKEVAVKILRPDQAASEEARSRFVEEARALAKLDHPHVVRVFDVVEDEGFVLIIMDLVPGRNLLDGLQEDGPVDPQTAVAYARQVAQALTHSHQQKILHRDVKPANVIEDDDGERVVLVDFGNAEVVGAAADRKGTAHYVAPEVFQGKRQDEKTDTYSLGATLFHLLTGEPPYKGQTTRDILLAHEAGKLRAPSQVAPDAGIPKSLDDLVKRSMAPARGYRFLAHEMDAALAEIEAELESGPRTRKTRRRRTSRAGAASRSSSNQATMMIVGGLVLAGAVAVALLATKGEEKPPVVTPTTEPPKTTSTETPETDGGKSLDPGFDKRASGREEREKAAATAFEAAEAFERSHGSEPKKVAEKFDAVAAEFAEYTWGRKAKERAAEWRDRAETTSDKEARAAALEAEKKARAEALKKVDEHLAALRVGDALLLLQRTDPDAGGEKEWERRQKRLNLLLDLKQQLLEGLPGTKVPLRDLRYDLGTAGDAIVGGSEEGLTVETSMGVKRTMAWTDLKPADLLALGREILPSRPEPRLTLAAWAWETGQRKEALKEIDTARLTDRVGMIGERVEECFGPEAER